MDKFSPSCPFPSKPDGYKNTSSTEIKEINKKIGYPDMCKIN